MEGCLTKAVAEINLLDAALATQKEKRRYDRFSIKNAGNWTDAQLKCDDAEEPNEPGPVVIASNYITVFNSNEVEKLAIAYTDSTRDQANRIKGLVKKIRASSQQKELVGIPEGWRDYCEDLERKFPNFAEIVAFVRNQLALSSKPTGDGVLRLPPFMLVGGPGIGKTEFALTIATDFKTTFELIDISSAQTGSPLAGSEAYWGNSQPGMLFNTLVFGDVANPIIMLDEVDKAYGRRGEYDPLSALHQLLEPRQARNFHDLSVVELTIDASHVIWIATANKIEELTGPIIDRFTIFNVEDPSKEQMPAIVATQYQRFIDKHPSGAFFERTIRDEVLAELCEYHPRKVRKILDLAFGLAAYDGREYLTVKDIRAGDVGDKRRPGIGFIR